MSNVELVFTLEVMLKFGLGAFALAICAHALLAEWTKTVFAVLLVIEIVVAIPYYFLEGMRQGTGIEIGIPGALVGLVVGNLLAIPVGRRLGMMFKVSAKR